MGIGKMRMSRCKRSFYGKDQRTIGGVGGPSTWLKPLHWNQLKLIWRYLASISLQVHVTDCIGYPAAQDLTATQPWRPACASPSSFTSTGLQGRPWQLRASASGWTVESCYCISLHVSISHCADSFISIWEHEGCAKAYAGCFWWTA